jgi:hypothetical protein
MRLAVMPRARRSVPESHVPARRGDRAGTEGGTNVAAKDLPDRAGGHPARAASVGDSMASPVERRRLPLVRSVERKSVRRSRAQLAMATLEKRVPLAVHQNPGLTDRR